VLVLHLMIAGCLHWKPAHAALRGRRNLAAFDFSPGSLTLTEAGSKPRASLHVVAVLADRGLSRLSWAPTGPARSMNWTICGAIEPATVMRHNKTGSVRRWRT
jgi:hypothetical protein